MTTDKKARKEMPVARGVFDYFPDAIAAVANVSYVGNQQHNPGQEMHWAREKSTDHADCVARHLIERGTIDDDGLRHSAKMAWRALALLQLELESKAPSHVRNNYFADFANKSMPVQYFPYADDITFDVYPAVFIPETSEDNVGTDTQARQLDAWIYENDFANPALQALHDRKGFLCDQLDRLGCKYNVIHEIIGGMTINTGSKQYAYIAGPMRGYDKFNFPAFDAARDEFLHHGWNVISPADIDRAAGFTESVPDQTLDQRTFAYRDFYSLYLLAHLGEGAIAMLPGWEKSTGAVAELFLARWLGLRILDATTGCPLRRTTVDQLSGIDETLMKYLKGQK